MIRRRYVPTRSRFAHAPRLSIRTDAGPADRGQRERSSELRATDTAAIDDLTVWGNLFCCGNRWKFGMGVTGFGPRNGHSDVSKGAEGCRSLSNKKHGRKGRKGRNHEYTLCVRSLLLGLSSRRV